MSGFVPPMLAVLENCPFDDDAWAFEPKLDGIRSIAEVGAGGCRLWSRRGLDITLQYPGVAASLPGCVRGEAILDGEIVALDNRGVPSFELLQGRMNLQDGRDIRHAEVRIPVHYYVFDLLASGGRDWSKVPYDERRLQLASVLRPAGVIRLLDPFNGLGRLAFEQAVAHGFEGVVAKRRRSSYQAGKRSRDWLKIKAQQSDEFLIVGYTAGTGVRADHFGALLLAQYDAVGELGYAGHVGTGFDRAKLDALLRELQSLRVDTCPLAVRPRINGAATWVRPVLVAEVKFMERTRDGKLRAPVFLRLRPDKASADVKQTPADALRCGLEAGASGRDLGRDPSLVPARPAILPAGPRRGLRAPSGPGGR